VSGRGEWYAACGAGGGEGKVYPKLADKVAAVEAELPKLEADPARVRSLAGWDWINTKVPTPGMLGTFSSDRVSWSRAGSRPSPSRGWTAP